MPNKITGLLVKCDTRYKFVRVIFIIELLTDSYTLTVFYTQAILDLPGTGGRESQPLENTIIPKCPTIDNNIYLSNCQHVFADKIVSFSDLA